jgi:hypothetical protein
LKDGDIRFLDLPGEVLGFERTDGTETLRLLFNLGDEAATIPVDSRWTEAFPLGAHMVGAEVALPIGTAAVFVR